MNFQVFKLGLEKAEEPEIKFPTSAGSSKKQEICMQVRKQQLELDMEQQAGFKSGKEYIKAVHCHPAYLTYMQSTSYKVPGWNQDCRRNIINLRYADDTTLMAESEEELKSLLMKVNEESENIGLKLNIQKTKIMASGRITSRQVDGKIVESAADFILGGLQNH